jgi:hypothetical protein
MSDAIASSLVRTQRLRAIVASTVGTTIEWYDFFLYGTMAGRSGRSGALTDRHVDARNHPAG